jgi:hypothetical protein
MLSGGERQGLSFQSVFAGVNGEIPRLFEQKVIAAGLDVIEREAPVAIGSDGVGVCFGVLVRDQQDDGFL